MKNNQKVETTKLAKALAISGLSLETLNLLVLPREPVIQTPVMVVSAALLAKYFLEKASSKSQADKLDMTKDILELYQIFLEEYHKLNKTFELKDPVELYKLFIYMLRKGYFSKDKQFEFSSQNARDIDCIMGANIMTGKGICRHITGMLADVYETEGIESHKVCVYHRDYKVLACEDPEHAWSKEQIDEWIDERFPDQDNKRIVKDYIDNLLNQGKRITLELFPIESRSISERIHGNHVINVARQGDIVYYIDPTNEKVYQRSQTRKYSFTENELEIPMKKGLTKSYNESKDAVRKIYELLDQNLQTVSPEEAQEKIRRVEKLIKANPDLLEGFYEDHKELYGDISDKVLKITKTGIFLTMN